ncbi:DERL2 [Hepatospora eriocheir]|uniref:Derlin n=1 Tax=Hepatospora eriocheir TaxID=1081669 RepID=A0A1X0QJR6_9MICR|nr:DERL2 [Hepatospora eriocheir]
MEKNILFHLYNTAPPVTRFVCILVGIVTFTVSVNLVNKNYFILSRYQVLYDLLINNKNRSVFNQLSVIERFKKLSTLILRFCLAPCYFGRLNFEGILHITFFYRYSSMLETSYVYISDYVFVLFLCYVTLIIGAMFVRLGPLGPSFSCIITYIWTRKNPRAIIQTFGFLTFPAFYLPFIIPVFTLLSDGTINNEESMGIVCGHIIFFFKDVFPKYSADFLRTPCFLHRLFKEEQDCCTGKKLVSRFQYIPRFISSNSNSTRNNTSDSPVSDFSE